MKCKIKNHKTGDFACERNIRGKIVKTNSKCESSSGSKLGNISVLGTGGGFVTSHKQIVCTDDRDIKKL